jgi:molybdenum cofactor biosynthesis enzyme MoaA
MPAEGVQLSPDAALLTLEERKTLLDVFVALGVNKVRFTGGEPTISSQLVPLIQYCHQKLHLRHISLTSNGVKLKELLPALVEAGLTSVNISLDTLKAKKFAEISRRPPQTMSRVFASIFAAQAAGIQVKVNCVVMRGVNEDELGDFVRFGQDQNLTVRFIELMPFDGNKWDTRQFVSYLEMSDLIHQQLQQDGSHSGKRLQRDGRDKDPHDTTKWFRLGPIQPAHHRHVDAAHSHSSNNSNSINQTAVSHTHSNNSLHDNSNSNNNSQNHIITATDTRHNSHSHTHSDSNHHLGSGYNASDPSRSRIGFITSMSSHFCGGCNRLRLTADGDLKTCLFGTDTLSLRDLLRKQSSAPSPAASVIAHLEREIDVAVKRKKDKLGGHTTPVDIARSSAENRPMILIGG